MSPINVIPEPKEIDFLDGFFFLDKSCRITLNQEKSEKVARNLQEGFSETLGFVPPLEDKPQTPELIIQIKKGASSIKISADESRIAELKPEGYFLKIDRDGVFIQGIDKAGLFYGIQTLIQMMQDGPKIKSLFMRDWPDLSIRGIHLDLKGVMPKYEYLLEAIKKFAHYKINTILIEYEDKFIYEKHPSIVSPVALTKDEVRRLVEVADENFIQVIPLIQCLGHVEYVLRHKQYEHLSELPGKEVQQYCPLNTKVQEMYKDLCSEIMPLHLKTEYFHMGGDETNFLGQCERCHSKVKKSGEDSLYIDYINKAADYIFEMGKKPIIWHDMLIKFMGSQIADKLSKKITIMYWRYSARNSESPLLFYEGTRYSKEWLKKEYSENPENQRREISPAGCTGWIEDISSEIKNAYREEWNTPNFPKMVNSLPYIGFLHKNGYHVIGASSIGSSRDNYFPLYTVRIPNVRRWAFEAKKNNMLGVISTDWSRDDGLSPPGFPFENLWYGIVASGEYYWSVNKVNDEEFDAKFNQRFFGLPTSGVTDIIYLLNKRLLLQKALEKLHEIKNKAKRNKLNLEYLELAIKIIWHEMVTKSPYLEGDGSIGAFEDRYYKLINGNITKSELIHLENGLRQVKNELVKLKEDANELFLKTMPEYEVAELLKCYFTLEEEKIERYLVKTIELQTKY